MMREGKSMLYPAVGHWLARFAMVTAALAGAITGSPAIAQAPVPADLVSAWQVTVEGEGRTRTFRIVSVDAKPDGTAALNTTYGWSDGPAGTVASQLAQSPEGRKITFTTQAKSVMTATQQADGSFAGTATYANGQSKPFKMVRITDAQPASAQAASTPAASKPAPANPVLSKEELASVVVGKEVVLARKRDGAEIVWKVAKDGNVYANNRTTRVSDTAEWTLRDDGAICLQWRGVSASGCVFMKKQDQKYTMHASRNGPVTYDVVEIQ